MFFSSRRRHTRFDCDWSSDVCSSDLPLEVAAGRGGGDRLVEREGLGIAVGRLGGERAPELLEVAVDGGGELAKIARAQTAAGRERAGAGAVELERRTVAAVLVEIVAAGEQGEIGRVDELDPAAERRVARGRVDIDRATPGLLDDRVAAGVEVVALEREAEGALRLREQEVEIAGVIAPVARLEKRRALDGSPGEDG